MSKENPFNYFFTLTEAERFAQALVSTYESVHGTQEVKDSYRFNERQVIFMQTQLEMSTVIESSGLVARFNAWLKSVPQYSHIEITVFTITVYTNGGLQPELHVLLTKLLCECFDITLPPELQFPTFPDFIVNNE